MNSDVQESIEAAAKDSGEKHPGESPSAIQRRTEAACIEATMALWEDLSPLSLDRVASACFSHARERLVDFQQALQAQAGER